MNISEQTPFETTNLLGVNRGTLAVSIIPVTDQPAWILPNAMILDIIACKKPVASYEWQDQLIPVLSLLAKSDKADNLVIVEGTNDARRVALLVQGSLKQENINISDLKDIELDAQVAKKVSPFVFQAVAIEENKFVVPDLQKIADQLIGKV